ncbi:probable magnesium transporter NIPA9 isoform X2 [Macadamia integrifolia]|uniref:probable magnesium transporter NIPA9 isoform X2 n=1 Tax=Macadamia integrifolia TaxID=60698 RepID=UPI001C4F6A09|nr:probable magnesium transporter NIPA9 isoform X2 [Macadamia integrifolia]
MWESICLTLIATAGNNIGKVLQKKGTVILPPLSFKFKVVRAYAFNKAWVIGFLMDIFGALLMLKALSQSPVSVIQPVSGCGLAILCIFSHFYLKEVMNVVDWVGIVITGVGTIGNEWVLEGRSKSLQPYLFFIYLYWFLLLHSCLSFLMDGSTSTNGSEENRSWMASVISKMGFVFLEQGFSKMLVPVCISISICCSATGFVYQTRGLKHGRAIIVSTCAAVASILTGVLAGMLALGEQLPSAPAARLSLLLGWLLIIVGVILLVSSTRLVRHLPRPWRRSTRGNSRQLGSVRARDSNPNAVIQATTLHHLLTSPAKEKA